MKSKKKINILLCILAIGIVAIALYFIINKQHSDGEITEDSLLSSITSDTGFIFRDLPWLASVKELQDSNLVPNVKETFMENSKSSSFIVPKYSIEFTELDSSARVEYIFENNQFYRGTYVFRFDSYDDYERAAEYVVKLMTDNYGDTPIKRNIDELFDGTLDSDGKIWRSEEDGSFVRVTNMPTTIGELNINHNSGDYYLGICVTYKMEGFDE